MAPEPKTKATAAQDPKPAAKPPDYFTIGKSKINGPDVLASIDDLDPDSRALKGGK